jgi:hypothetical protein
MYDEEGKKRIFEREILLLLSFSDPDLLVTHFRPPPIALLMVTS